VDEFQRLLADLTGAPVTDQILTHEGAPLAPANLLADYGLFDTEKGEKTASKDVFLYSRALLRHDAANPTHLETLPELPKPPETPSEEQTSHQLDTASSPLLRALPEYHRQFKQHLREAEAAADASASRVAFCCRVVNESEVQAMAVDAAMASVEPHYAFICNAQASFQDTFSRKFQFHQQILSSFDADVDFLESIELPEQLHYNTISKLSDLVDLEGLKTIATECRRSHRRFAARVSELESLHAALRTDVETLFMRAPCVDLDSLSQGLAAAAAGTDEQASIIQALAADLRKAETALAEATAATSSASSSASTSMSIGLQDTVGMLEAMHEAHMTTALRSVEQQRTAIETFAHRCVDAKNALSIDALHALRTIASQQSKIREMKEALAPFPAALERQDAQINSLLVVRRLPAAFKQALAECLRRAAFTEKYSSYAEHVEEQMGKFRLKEEAMRSTFKGHVEGQLPFELLSKMGLEQPPPVCTVSVPQEEVRLLLPVTPDDLRRLQLPRYASGTSGITSGGGGGGTSSDVQGSSSSVGTRTTTVAAAAAAEEAPAASASQKSEKELAEKDALILKVQEEAEKEAAALKKRIVELETALANLQAEVGAPAAPAAAGSDMNKDVKEEEKEQQTTETQPS
jgi:autophagy-related protein 11